MSNNQSSILSGVSWSMQPVLINGNWVDSESVGTFHAANPHSATSIAIDYPVSSWSDCEAALDAAARAHREMRNLPCPQIASYLERYADRLEARAEEICDIAYQETGLPIRPRRLEVELPRTTGQLRQAAHAARHSTWSRPTIRARSCRPSPRRTVTMDGSRTKLKLLVRISPSAE